MQTRSTVRLPKIAVLALALVFGFSALPAHAAPRVERIAGPNRYVTAAGITSSAFADGSAPVVYIATGMNFPDALAGGAAAANLQGALLLVSPDEIPAEVRAEIVRLKPSRIVVLGSTLAVSAKVETQLRQLTTGTVTRHAGSSRFDTALLASRGAFTSADSAIIAYGMNFPDALSAGSLFVRYPGPILLSDGQGPLPPETMQELKRLGVSRVFVLGSTRTVPQAVSLQLSEAGYVTTRLGGSSRYDTSLKVAQTGHPNGAKVVYLTTGLKFPDGLAAGPVAKLGDGPVILTDGQTLIRDAADVILTLRPDRIVILGAQNAVADSVLDGLRPIASVMQIPAGENSSILSEPYGNDLSGNVSPWASPSRVAYRSVGDRVQVLTVAGTNTLTVNTIDAATLRTVGGTRTVSLPSREIFGGIYPAPDGNTYVLTGNRNPDEIDTKEVMTVTKIDADWRVVGKASLQGGASQHYKGVTTPFAFSAPGMVLTGETLVVHSGRMMYKSDDGLNHQSNMTFKVDTKTMKAQTFQEAGLGYPYVSHSFNQFVTTWNDRLVFVDHGDAYPRSIALESYTGFPGATNDFVGSDLLLMNGQIGENQTGTSVTGVSAGTNNVLVVGNSVPHTGAPKGTFEPFVTRNVFVIGANPDTGKSETKWLTQLPKSSKDVVGQPRLVSIGDDMFVVLFTVTSGDNTRLEYRLVDSSLRVLAAHTLATESWAWGTWPVVSGSRLLWLLPSGSGYVMTGIDISDPASPGLLTR